MEVLLETQLLESAASEIRNCLFCRNTQHADLDHPKKEEDLHDILLLF